MAYQSSLNQLTMKQSASCAFSQHHPVKNKARVLCDELIIFRINHHMAKKI